MAVCPHQGLGPIAQLVRALRLHRRGRGFESLWAHLTHKARSLPTELLMVVRDLSTITAHVRALVLISKFSSISKGRLFSTPSSSSSAI